MTAELLTGIAGIVLSVVFSYFPKLNTWFAAKPEETKKLYMLGMIIIVAGVTFGLSCANLLGELTGLMLACDKATVIGLVKAIFAAAIGNQIAFRLSPQTTAVKSVKPKSVG